MKSALSILALLLFLPAIADAQSPAVAVGSRVRLTAPYEGLRNHVTTVENVRGDSIVVRFKDGWRTIALADVAALEVSLGQRRPFFRDASLGLGIGTLAGVVLGAATYQECRDCWFAPQSRAQQAALGGVLLGVVGLASGAVVGLVRRVDLWESIELPVKVAITPGRSGGMELKISRAF